MIIKTIPLRGTYLNVASLVFLVAMRKQKKGDGGEYDEEFEYDAFAMQWRRTGRVIAGCSNSSNCSLLFSAES